MDIKDELILFAEIERNLGNLETAKEYLKKIKHIEFQQIIEQKQEYIPESFVKKIGMFSVPNLNPKYKKGNVSRVINYNLLVTKIKLGRLESLLLFDEGKPELGNEKIIAIYDEIKLYDEYIPEGLKQEHHRFVNEISKEINQVSLLSEYLGAVSDGDNVVKVSDDDLDIYLSKSIDELYELIGKQIPDYMKESNRLLEYKAILAISGNKIVLPENTSVNNNDKKAGITLFDAFKKSLYNIICDPKNRVGKEIISGAKTKDLIAGVLMGVGVKSNTVITAIIALVILFGIETYCLKSKPQITSS